MEAGMEAQKVEHHWSKLLEAFGAKNFLLKNDHLALATEQELLAFSLAKTRLVERFWIANETISCLTNDLA